MPLYKISIEKLDVVKRYLDSYLAKRFIQANSDFYLFLVLFVKKSGRGIQFCVGYQKFNAIIKKDQYSLPLIEETLAQLEVTKYFNNIDIRQAFY